ncbi:murein biosynthesis integral membrane protein MurJ [Tepidiforma sp.]|uniref:murein biosynthesis integral membrane protein MurJ n=1 Tax=Tepidiforma sp. TaxID=2682230 RepID=UPI00260CC584|nr:murein biosynthesis integral membrane protein MurJ [Tepidiforma sp.]MCX7617190.1 murein biosynthesis integral membrane protein MurJ [Tepidiforma sp.]
MAPGAEGRRTARSAGGGLALAAAIVAFGFVGSRLLGIVRTIVIANAFGASPELDAYNVAFRIPDLIFQVLAGATLGSAFIPVFARKFEREGAAEAWLLASRVLNLVVLATAALCAAAFVLAPLLVPAIAPGLGDDIGRSEELTGTAVELTRVMLVSTLLFAASGMLTGMLNGRERFFLPALAPMLYNLGIILGAVVFADRWGVNGLAFGVVLGAAMHLGIQVPGVIAEGFRYRPSLGWGEPGVMEVARLMAPRVVGLAAAQVNFVVTGFFASKVGASAISNMTYAWLLAGLPLALFGMALSTAVFPRLAGQVAREELDGLNRTVSRVLRLIMFLTVPAALGLAMLREPAAITLLERGAFTRADSLMTAAALGWYCLGIVPQAGIEIHSRGFYALGDTRTPVTLAVLAVGVNLLLGALLWEPFGVSGLAFAVGAASWAEWLGLYALFLRRTGWNPAEELSAMARVALAGALMAAVLAVATVLLDSETRAHAAVTAAAGVAAGALCYGAACLALRVPELEDVTSRLAARLRRGPAPG